MRLVAAALVFNLAVSPALAEEMVWSTSAGALDATIFACNESCANEQLVCAHFVQAGAKDLTVEILADGTQVRWRLVDYAVAAMALDDRGLNTRVAVTGAREAGPGVVSFAGFDWVEAYYSLSNSSPALDAYLLVWPVGSELQGVRCSFTAGSDVRATTEKLAASLR